MTWRPHTLVEVARRVAAGEDSWSSATAEFLDTFYVFLRQGDLISAQAALNGEPEPLADAILQAQLGGIGEHLALRWGLNVPAWTNRPSRFLKRPYFTTPLDGFKAMLIAESPLAFRRRMIFTEAEPLRRARFPRAPGGRALEREEIRQGVPVPPVRARIPEEKAKGPRPLDP